MIHSKKKQLDKRMWLPTTLRLAVTFYYLKGLFSQTLPSSGVWLTAAPDARFPRGWGR